MGKTREGNLGKRFTIQTVAAMLEGYDTLLDEDREKVNALLPLGEPAVPDHEDGESDIGYSELL